MPLLLRAVLLPRETVEPLVRAPEPVLTLPEVPRVAEVPLRVAVVAFVRTAVPLRETPGAAVRLTLVRPVEERRVALVLPPEAELPPARVRPLRVDDPPREAKLRVLRDASRCPTWRAWLFRWIQRPLHPPTP